MRDIWPWVLIGGFAAVVFAIIFFWPRRRRSPRPRPTVAFDHLRTPSVEDRARKAQAYAMYDDTQ